MSLEEILAKQENQKVDSLARIYHLQIERETFMSELLTLLSVRTHQKGASWLLKHHLEQGHTLTEEEIVTLAGCLRSIFDWESRLHLLQVLPMIALPDNTLLSVEDFVRESLPSEHKFVRAWAVQGLFELSKKRPDLQREVLFLCEKAMQTEAASVKARVRKILIQIQ